MRTLNRPMFRYGGPIKEGVMNGIRENKKHGGSMGNNLVGSNAYPKTNGREHHFLVSGSIATAAALNAARIAATRAAMTYGPRAIGGVKRGIGAIKGMFGKNKPFQGPVGSSTTSKGTFTRAPGVRIPSSGTYSGVKYNPGVQTASGAGPAMGEAFVTNPLGTYLSGTMSGKLVSGLYKGATSPTAVGLTQKAGKAVWSVAKDPLTIASAGFYFYPDGTPKPDSVIADQGQKPELGLEGLLKTSVDNGAAKNENVLNKADKRKTQVEKYRDIMDIKGMNKNAAYDSLIAASQAVLGEGDFKGSLKDGSLIGKIIGSTSKSFDKPRATKDAIDTLILKGEIEGDIAAGKPSTYLKTAQDMVATGASKNIQEAMKKLTKSENSMSATLGALLAKNTRLDENTVGVAYREETGNIPSGTTKLSVVNEWKGENEGKNEIDYVKELIKKGAELTAGDYIIGERVVTINDSGVPSFFY